MSKDPRVLVTIAAGGKKVIEEYRRKQIKRWEFDEDIEY